MNERSMDPETARRMPPHHAEAERTVLGAILRDNGQLDDLSHLLLPEDFYRGAHKRIYDAMLKLFARGEPIDLVTLSDEVGVEALDDIGGMRYLSELFDATPPGTDTRHYGLIVKEKSLRRRLIHLSTESAAACFDSEQNLEALIADMERELMDLTEGEFSQPYQAVDDLLTEAVKRIEIFYKSKQPVTGLSTGFHDLDEYTSGLHPKELTIVAARPGMGKTAFTLNMASNVAKHDNVGVLFFSLEMGAEQLVQRLLCSEAGVDSRKLQKGFIDQNAWKRLMEAANEISKLPLYIDDSPMLTVPSMLSKARRLKGELTRRGEGQRLGMVVVDYLQLMTGQGRAENRNLEISAISRGLKLLAKDLEIPVVALSQLNRGVESRSDKRPMLSDLRESGAIEQDADVITFLYRDEVYNEETMELNIAEVIIGKQRNGPLGTAKLFFNAQYTRFDNLDTQHVPDAEAAYEL